MKTNHQSGERQMPYEIDIVADAMVLLDRDGNSCECATLTGLRAAKRTIQTWAGKYTLDVGEAYKRLATYFSR